MKLTHVRLLVVNFEACFRFYRDVMGFEASWGDETSGYADFEVGEGTALALFGRQAMADVVGMGGTPLEAECQDRAMLIFGVDDLEAAVARLKAKGATFVRDIEDHPDWGIRTAHLRDPEGTLIEINSPLPQEEWAEGLREESRKYEEG